MVIHDLLPALQISYREYITPLMVAPYSNDPAIGKIIVHTENVISNILILADHLALSEDEKALAEIMARFHDIGRLWSEPEDNSAAIITDHAEASIEYLKRNSVFAQLDEATQNLIILVIRYHNKSELPKKENETVLFFVKLLRDADKLDSWRATSEYVTMKGGKPNMAKELSVSEKPLVTPSFCKIIIEGGIPSKNDIVTFNDFVIFQMSWIFDLNFKKSFQILNQRQYMRHLYDTLPKNDIVIEIYRMIRIFMENNI